MGHELARRVSSSHNITQLPPSRPIPPRPQPPSLVDKYRSTSFIRVLTQGQKDNALSYVRPELLNNNGT
jgi:hypothetical protein